MKNILILPEEGDSYRALSGDRESTGRTPGQALDALRSQLTEEEAGTLVIVQSYKSDRFFDAAQQERLAELMRLREAGELTAEEEGELESLVEAELLGATERAEAMSDAAGRKVLPRPLPENPYLERIAAECMVVKAEVEGRISSASQNPALAQDIIAEAIKRVIEYADRHRGEKEIGSVKGLLITTAQHLLSDAQSRKLKADKVETVSWGDAAEGGLPNLPYQSATNEIERRIEAAELKEIALRDTTPAQRMLFKMWFEQGMTPSEISVELGISLSAVKLRLHTLITTMRDAIMKNTDK